MAGTYSKYNNTDWLSTSSFLVLLDSGTQSYAFNNAYLGNDVYTNLIDNESKLLQPKHLRNSILSLWDLPTFKLTTASGSNIGYIGMDSGTSSVNVEVKNRKILFGKRSYKNSEIIKDLLTITDTDIFFYNTKDDNDLQYKTKLTLLSGNSPSIYQPSIVSKYVQGRTASLYLDILNQDDIQILSRSYDIKNYVTTDNNLGSTVSVNNIVFPTYGTNSTSNINGKYLMVKNGIMTWTSSGTSSLFLGVTGSELNIYGSKTTLNDYELDFTDTRMTPYDLGGIVSGTTFSKDSLTEVLARIIYNNTPPKCELNMLSGIYHEVGTSPEIMFKYKVKKFNNPLLPTRLTNMIPSQLAPISNDESIVIDGLAEAVFIKPIIQGTSSFSIRVQDIYGGTNRVSKFIKGVYPYYYGFSTYSIPEAFSKIDIFELEKFTKLVEDKGNKTIDIFGEGNLFFIYDKDYGPLKDIKNNNKILNFPYNIATFSSPNGFWDSKQFYIYGTNSVIIDLPSKKYTFNF